MIRKNFAEVVKLGSNPKLIPVRSVFNQLKKDLRYPAVNSSSVVLARTSVFDRLDQFVRQIDSLVQSSNSKSRNHRA